MRFGEKILLLTLGVFLLSVAGGPARGQVAKEPTVPEPAPEIKEPAKERPVEPPGYFPGLLPPSTIGTIEAGPVSGLLAPYGNPAAYDNLLRGWRSHQAGKMTLVPFLEVAGQYRSNIFSTPADKQSDFLTTIIPGLRAEMRVAEKHRLSLGYLGNAFIYSRFSNQSHYDQNFNADLALNPEGKMSVRFGNTLRLATEERNSEFAVERNYLRNTPYITATYKLADRWKLEGNYQLDTLHFAKSADRFNDFNQHSAGATLYYRFLPKTAVLAQYIFVYREYPYLPADNTYSSSPLIGLSWDPTAKLSGNIKFGYTFANYETSINGRNNSPDGWTLSAQLTYRYSRYTSLMVTGQRSFQQDPDFANAGYNNSGVWITLNHDWTKFRVFSYISFFYVNNSYLNPAPNAVGQIETRDDNLVGFGVGVSRPVTRWLNVRLAYSYVNRSSNFPGYGYNDNRVLGGIQASF